jgi:hypothetical protein
LWRYWWAVVRHVHHQQRTLSGAIGASSGAHRLGGRVPSGAAIGGGAGLLGGYAYDQYEIVRAGHEGICLILR